MTVQADISVVINGQDVTSRLSPALITLSVSLQAGGEASTAAILLNDKEASFLFPQIGADVTVALGWRLSGRRQVFAGVIDAATSIGTRRGGRQLSLSAKGFDATGGPKEQQRRHWDDATVREILEGAARDAKMDGVSVDPDLAETTLSYWAMVDESFLHMGQRLAEEIGGHFRVDGKTALMARRGGLYAPFVGAAAGSTLHAWSIAPALGRGRYGRVRAPWYDQAAAAWTYAEAETGVEAEAVLTLKPAADKADAERQAKAAAATVERDAGGGSLTIEGNPAAIPDGIVRVSGARPGIDGAYRIVSVTHYVTRASGFVTSMQVGRPHDGAGEDNR